MKALVAVLAIVIALSGEALAWGGEGHRLVAEIAERYLEPDTARQVRELLAASPLPATILSNRTPSGTFRSTPKPCIR
jgi:hypothetical protein